MSEELFKRYLMSLPDSAFFDIYRTYLGPVSTPFRKQELCSDLCNFLRRPEVQQRIVDLIDQDDSYWLTVIDISASFSPERAQQIFHGRLSPVEIHQRMLNLEDRMLIVIDPDSKSIQLNPILRPLLQEHAVNMSRILPFEQLTAAAPGCPMNEAAWFTFYSFFRHPQQIFKQSGGIRKKDMELLEGIFFQFPAKGVLGTAIESIIHALAAIGLLRPGNQDSTAYMSSRPAWEKFLKLPRKQALAYLAAGMIVPESRQLEATARGCHAFLSLLQPSSRYLIKDLISALQFSFTACNGPSASWTADTYRALCSLGILWPDGEEHCISAELSSVIASDNPVDIAAEEESVIVQPSFEVTITHNAPIGKLLPLASLLEPRRCDIYPQFELTRDRCLHAFIHEPEAFELLSTYSKGNLPQNVTMSLELWETEGRSLSLYSGTILKADEQRRHIIEHHHNISRLIQEILAPGVYLMRGSQREVQAAFADAGLGNIPSRSRSLPGIETAYHFPLLPESVFLHTQKQKPSSSKSHITDTPIKSGNQSPGIELIHAKITEQDSRELMEHLLEQKLILLPEQISSRHLPKERNEARGIDYMGKVRLLERILRSSSDLAETTERDRNGKPIRRLIRPTALKPRGADLFVSGLQLPGGEPIHLQVRKLSLVRKVRSGFNSASHD
ncbi:hypothetical protein [Spirochaeta dissipatitropha]